jgi:hypothetical protein
MDLVKALADVNALAVFVGTLLAFGIGALWYSPVMFVKPWMKELGKKAKDTEVMKKDSSLGQLMGASFILTLALALTIGMLFNAVEATGLTDGLALGLFVGLGLTATTAGIHYLFEQRSFKLFAINAGYNVAMCLVIGAVVGIWPQ